MRSHNGPLLAIAAAIAALAIAVIILAASLVASAPRPPERTCTIGAEGLPTLVVPGTCPPGVRGID